MNSAGGMTGATKKYNHAFRKNFITNADTAKETAM